MMDLLVSLYFRQLDTAGTSRTRPTATASCCRGTCCDWAVLGAGAPGYLDVTTCRRSTRVAPDCRYTRPDAAARAGRLNRISRAGAVGRGRHGLGAQLGGKTFHTWVMLGDGEIQEGMVWEAVQVAAR